MNTHRWMFVALTVTGVFALLAVAVFCAFGFLATLEPNSPPVAFRIGVSAVALSSIVGAMLMIVKVVRK